MVGRWGMSHEVGPVDLRESEEHPFLGREIAQPRRFSEHSAQAVDKAVQELILHAEQQALEIIRRYRRQLLDLIALLEEKETLARADIDACLGVGQAVAPAAFAGTGAARHGPSRPDAGECH
jgi:cell division protease FtsH